MRQSVRDVLAAPLIEGVRLADVSADRRLNELEFHLPVAQGDEAGRKLTHDQLAEVFVAHPSAEIGNYAERVARLRFPPLHGYLKGYVDLVFEHEERWYVVDYKTSWLGEHVEDYSPERLRLAQDHGHYYLQYHLYAVAVHRRAFIARRSCSSRARRASAPPAFRPVGPWTPTGWAS